MASKEQSRVSQAGDGVAKQSISYQGGDGQRSRAEYSRTGDVQSSVIR